MSIVSINDLLQKSHMDDVVKNIIFIGIDTLYVK